MGLALKNCKPELFLSRCYRFLSGSSWFSRPGCASFADMTQEKISLRAAGFADIPALSAMAGRIFHETFTGMMPEEDLQAYIVKALSPDQLHSEWTDPATNFIIASRGGEWAGYAKINTRRRPERPEPEGYIEMERLYVLKGYHGMGIGSLLMESCVRYAVDHGFKTLWLTVWERNTQAMEFYRRKGFEFVDWSIFMRGNDPQKALWMKKKL